MLLNIFFIFILQLIIITGNLNIWLKNKNVYFINKLCAILGISSLPITICVFISYLLTGD